jgi:hypothetical protein
VRKKTIIASCLLPLIAVAALFQVDASAGTRRKKPRATPTPTVIATPTPTASTAPTPTPAPTLSPSPSLSPTPTASAQPTTSDALVRRVRAELKVFTDWLATNNAKGYIGEFGWPNSFPADQDEYNALADIYLADMRAAGVTGAGWATGEWWGTSYHMSSYIASGSSAINTARPQASVLERNTDVTGIQVNGGEFGAVYGTTSTSSFSNVNPGTYNQAWHYDSQATFNYLASRGIKEVVIPFRWERIQPTLGGSLNSTEVQRLKDAITRAHQAGVTAVPIVANYGAYWLHDAATNKGVRRAIGGSHVSIEQFADLWKKLSGTLSGHAGIASYGLMREPASLPGATNREQAQVWERASQAAVDAIRANGDNHVLLVSGYRFSNTHTWPTQHPAKWINDPANNHVYEAHHYWAASHDASYRSYAEEVSLAAAKGY